MKKVQAPTLEEAYQKAAAELSCSITDLQYEVIQHPSRGILGLFKKEAIIVASCKKAGDKPEKTEKTAIAEETFPVIEEATVLQEDSSSQTETLLKEDQVVDTFFQIDQKEEEVESEVVVYDELARLIEKQLKELMGLSCFDIDVVEVDVRDNTALIFIDGEDAALLIGKEGYRYNALAYMLFNWLHTKYELFIKLEIAEFLTKQQEMIRNYIGPVIEKVEKHGKGRTRYLDGILVQIALEQLREAFPDKYVAVKMSRNGKKFVVINAFHRK
ncbi:MAG: Jag N-terminal domain-containing protein [Sulfurimonas sp.]